MYERKSIVLLRKLRNEYQYTEEYIAHKLNIDQSAYSRIESGKVQLSYQRAKCLAKVYGISVHEIMEEYSNEER